MAAQSAHEPSSLNERNVIVTGGARGIGLAIARQCALAGARIGIVDINADLASESAERLRSDGFDAQSIGVDVTNESEVDRMVAWAVQAFGAIDVFFNNAGIIKIQDWREVSAKDWDEVMGVNTKGVFLCAQAVAKHMLDRVETDRPAHTLKIINTASIAGRLAVPDGVHYAASKAGVISITRSFASILARSGVTVNAMAPGMVDTDMWDLIDEQTAAMRSMQPGEPRRRRARRIPIGRSALADDIARVALFLASGQSDYMTGQTLNIDGGNVMS